MWWGARAPRLGITRRLHSAQPNHSLARELQPEKWGAYETRAMQSWCVGDSDLVTSMPSTIPVGVNMQGDTHSVWLPPSYPPLTARGRSPESLPAPWPSGCPRPWSLAGPLLRWGRLPCGPADRWVAPRWVPRWVPRWAQHRWEPQHSAHPPALVAVIMMCHSLSLFPHKSPPCEPQARQTRTLWAASWRSSDASYPGGLA